MKELVLGIVLTIQGYIDFRHKEIPFLVSVIGAVIGGVFCIIEERSWISVLLACIPGSVALLFSKLTHEVMGYGDGILLVVMGIYLSWEKLIAIGMLAFSIAGVFALVLFVVFRKKGSFQIPFVPFLTVVFWLEYFIALGGAGG